jgi:hypothetical protein
VASGSDPQEYRAGAARFAAIHRPEAETGSGSLIVADNADYFPPYVARMRASGSGYLSVGFGEDVELSMRLN